MPFKKIVLKLPSSDEAIVRGTEQATEMVEIMTENWDQLQEAFKGYSDDEKEELMDHFNCAIDSLGDALFGDDSNISDFK